MKALSVAGVRALPSDFFEGTESTDLTDAISEEGRKLDTRAAAQLLAHATASFENPTESDGWLAPRIHAALRLTRREGASRDLWAYLAAVEAPEYYRWRWATTRSRLHAADTIQAVSRLWWTAELLRVGDDYSRVERGFAPPDIPNTILRLKAAHNRAFCAAFVTFVEQRRSDGKRLIGRQVNRLSTAINTQFFVASLDAVAPEPQPDREARKAWLQSVSSFEELLGEVPAGPRDLVDPFFESRVEAAAQLLDRVADGAGIATADNPRAGSKRPGDAMEEDEAEEQDAGLDIEVAEP